MEQTKDPRFPQETEKETDAAKTPAPAEEGESTEEKRRAFQDLIQNTYRQEYEDAVGKRIQSAIQQRFRGRQEQSPAAQAQAADTLRRHFESLSRQAEALRGAFPGFDLMQEMRSPEFVRLTAPGSGVSVKDAFYALHGEEIQRDSIRYAAKRAGERLAASVQAGASRPLENGMNPQGPVSLGVDIAHMDKKTREEYRRRIHSGETINFTDRV